MSDKSTPHIAPNGVEIAPTVFMPGDPLRAKYIAENYLDHVQQFNAVRNMLGYTGSFEGTAVSVLGSGMGIPSISISAWKLFHIFGAKRIIRVGSCGSTTADIDLYEIIIAQSASTDSNILQQYNLPGTFAPTASWNLLKAITDQATAKDIRHHVGNILSSDTFYNADETAIARWARMGVIGVEMESAALYALAAHAGAEALGIFTVSDNIVTGRATSAKERETAFTQMMELALPLAKLY
mgnify:CR=1 FL=1